MGSRSDPSSSCSHEVIEGLFVSNLNEATAVYSSSEEVERKEKKQRSNIPFLPDELIHSILLFLPADVLHNVMRLVCRSWLDIITSPDFINMHLDRSPAGLLVQISHRQFGPEHYRWGLTSDDLYNDKRKRGYLMEIKEEQINNDPLVVICPEISNPDDRMLHSCDGLVLVKDRGNVLHVKNPVTKQCLSLIPLPVPSESQSRRNNAALCSVGSASGRREYKVVYSSCERSRTWEVFINTLGAHISWRSISTEQIVERNILGGYMISVPGFIYWYKRNRPIVLAFDVEAETFHQVNPPNINELQMYPEPVMDYINSENFLILAARLSLGKWDMWFLLDSKVGWWEKFYQLDLQFEMQAIHSRIRNIGLMIPILALMKDGQDVIIFSVPHYDGFVGYRIKTRNIFTFGNTPIKGKWKEVAHVQSLVRFFSQSDY